MLKLENCTFHRGRLPLIAFKLYPFAYLFLFVFICIRLYKYNSEVCQSEKLYAGFSGSLTADPTHPYGLGLSGKLTILPNGFDKNNMLRMVKYAIKTNFLGRFPPSIRKFTFSPESASILMLTFFIRSSFLMQCNYI